MGRIVKAAELKPNDTIRVVHIEGEPRYINKVGTVTHIDDMGMIHMDWGTFSLCADDDVELL